MADTQPILRSGQNQYGEEDPRLMYQGDDLLSNHPDLVEITGDIAAASRGLPTIHEIDKIEPSLEQILTELYEVYNNHIEPRTDMSLAQMHPKRREKAEKWRKIFIEKKLYMFTKAPVARDEAIVYLQDVWNDVLAIGQGEGNRG